MGSKAFEDGLAMRKKVLGPDYVAKTFASADDLLLPFQEMLTEFAWGKIWTRPGMNLKTRSLLTLAMCIALNRPHEIRLHLRGALRNGANREEIRELLMHAFVYCGGPASVDAFNVIRTALPEIEELEKASKKAGRAVSSAKKAGAKATTKTKSAAARKAVPVEKKRRASAG